MCSNVFELFNFIYKSVVSFNLADENRWEKIDKMCVNARNKFKINKCAPNKAVSK